MAIHAINLHSNKNYITLLPRTAMLENSVWQSACWITRAQSFFTRTKQTDTMSGCAGWFITKTCLYKFDPLEPHFYTVKLGFTGVYIIFLISAQKHRLWILVRIASARRFYRVSTIYVFEQIYEKYQSFLSENFPVFGGEIFYIFE